MDLDTKSIMLDKPIDSLGEFDVPLWVDGRELEEKLTAEDLREELAPLRDEIVPPRRPHALGRMEAGIVGPRGYRADAQLVLPKHL